MFQTCLMPGILHAQRARHDEKYIGCGACLGTTTPATDNSSSNSSCSWFGRQGMWEVDHSATTSADRLMSSLNCSSSGRTESPSQPCWRPQCHRHVAAALVGGSSSSSSTSRRKPAWRATFASLHTGSQIGQQRQGHDTNSRSEDGSSTAAVFPAKQQQRQQQGQQGQQGVAEEVVERDLKRLAQDVFAAGDKLSGGRYTLQAKIPAAWGLADGRFTTVWKATDAATNSDVILKCVEGGDGDSYTAGTREAALHAAAGRHPNLVNLLDAFEHRSSTGRHAVLVLEPAGTNLELVLEQYVGAACLDEQQPALYQGICGSPRTLKHIARHTLSALDHIHKRGLAHMDLSLDNLLLDNTFKPTFQIHRETLFPPGNWLKGLHSWWRVFTSERSEQAKQALSEEMAKALMQARVRHEGNLHRATIKLADFGRAVPFRQLQEQEAAAAAGTGDKRPDVPQGKPVMPYNKDGLIVFGNPMWRPPEEVLAMDYARPSYDMWRLGCLLYQLATAEQLFDITRLQQLRDETQKRQLQRYDDNELLLFAMTDVLGPFPREFVRRSPLFSDYFIDKSSVKRAQSDPLRITNVLLTKAGGIPLTKQLKLRTALDDADVTSFAAFLTPLLTYDPAERPSAEQMMKHRWLQTDLTEPEDDVQEQQD